MSPVGALVVAACLGVNPRLDHITAGDLAGAVPPFASAAPEAPVALAPAPGVRRILRAAEIGKIAETLRVSVDAPPDLCFERRLSQIDESAVRVAMQRALPDARITVLSFTRTPAPEGDIEFPLSGLTLGRSGNWWKGFVRYGINHRFIISAKVEALASVPRVLANELLAPGVPVTSGQVRLETREEAPVPGGWAVALDQIVGRIPRRRIPAGTMLDRSWFEAAKEVARGDRIRVEVWSGAAHLEMEGTAQSSGAIGQNIAVLNPDSKRRFQARVEGPGRASVRRDMQ